MDVVGVLFFIGYVVRRFSGQNSDFDICISVFKFDSFRQTGHDALKYVHVTSLPLLFFYIILYRIKEVNRKKENRQSSSPKSRGYLLSYLKALRKPYLCSGQNQWLSSV